MQVFIGVTLVLLSVWLVFMMIRQHHRGSHPLLSVRNFAIVGFIIYQLVSAGRALWTDSFGEFRPQFPGQTGLIFFGMVIVFMVCFDYFYKKGWGTEPVIRRIPIPQVSISGPAMVAIAVILTILGFIVRFGFRFPLIGIVTDRWGMAFATMACGAAGWAWATRMRNPLMFLFVAVILMANGMNALTDTFGRRPLVGLGAALLWGLFYAGWRFLPTKQLLIRMGFCAVVPILFVGLFTGARQAQDFDRSADEQLRAMATADITEGVLDLFSGQLCGPVSMWLIDAYPERFEYRHAMALRYLFLIPIPRDWWENKPDPLSTLIAHQAKLPDVNRSLLTIGPGIIGHAAAEGGWYILVLYALVGAFILRMCDEIVARNTESPLIVLVIGASMGDTMGLTRGESSAFMFNMLVAIGGGYMFTLAVSKYFGRRYTQSFDEFPDETDEYDLALDPGVE